MAVLPRALDRRQYYNGDPYYYNSPFDNYGRWIVLVAIIIGAFFLFLIFSCITARRRRRAGMNPYRGTGWAAGRTPAGHAPAQYNPQPSPFFAPNQQQTFTPSPNPPVYSPSANNYYQNGQNQGYFGGQQAGIELQQPNQVHQPQRGGEPVYNPPYGPPPAKEDGIIR